MLTMPIYIPLLFVLTAIITLLFFFKASRYNKTVIIVILCWMLLQAIISLSGFYSISSIPPRFPLLIIPPALLITGLFISPAGRRFIDGLSLPALTLLHIIRVPVELVLLLLSVQHFIPVLMTFEGRNFDILSGITAPFIYYLFIKRKNKSYKILLTWNFVCLALLFNIVINAVLSVPSPFQQFAFDQPAVAVQYFPFTWLPSVVVPIVLFAHMVSIRQLIKAKNT